MRIRHQLPSASSKSTVQGDRAFLLRNQIGDFCTFYTTPQTRYEGWFVQRNDIFYKIVERIEIDEAPAGIAYYGSSAAWEYASGTRLSWKLYPSLSGLCLHSTQAVGIRVTLDIRPMYGHPELGRDYRLEKDQGGYLVTYTDPVLSEPICLHLRTAAALEETPAWQERFYSRDQRRHSPPDALFVYTLGRFTTTQLSFGAGRTAAEARESSLAACSLKPVPPAIAISHTPDTLVSHTATAKAAVRHSLRLLQTQAGVYAGLPWFHQIWSRDDLITALGYDPEEQRAIIRTYLGHPIVEGELPTYIGSGTTCADGIGWFCLLVREHGLEGLDLETKERLLDFLQAAREGLVAYRQASHGLIRSGHNATWMDTLGREGFRIEIQCMYALLLELLYMLTEEGRFEQERLHFVGKVRHHFWHQNRLLDGLGDQRIRPNVFLAYLLQPDLLSEQSWQLCFDTTLAALRTDWGGLTSLDRSDPIFQPASTGEDNKSYQKGDSWFFINNLAGIALHRFNPRRYGKDIVGILQSSTDEILWHNFVGHPGEISSAEKLESFGCGIQAFSGGTYLALLEELETSGENSLDPEVRFWKGA